MKKDPAEEWTEVPLGNLVLPPKYIAEAIDTGNIERTPDLESRLEIVARIKSFGFDTLGLAESQNYMKYKEIRDARTLYRLYITPPNALPGSWDNWITVGEDKMYAMPLDKPAVLASSTVDLRTEADIYEHMGYDVMHREISNFSDARGCDLTSEFIERSIMEQAATIFHEDWHNSIRTWHPGTTIPSEIDEAAASVIGRAGSLAYTLHTYGSRSEHHKQARSRFNRRLREAFAINETLEELQKLYSSYLDDEQKGSRKKRILKKMRKKGWEFDNAILWDKYPYCKHYPLMVDAYRKAGSVRGFINLMRTCPIDEPGAVEYLRDFVDMFP